MPNYPADGIVNGANFTSGPVAPNEIVSLFGTSLAWDTRAISSSDIAGGTMPQSLDSVEVYVAGYPAYLYYVSPLQVNLLIPNFLRPGIADVFLARDGGAGPVVSIALQAASPALFETSDGRPIATHLNGSLVTKKAPAGKGEIIVLWATGLGCVEHADPDGTIPTSAEWLCNMSQFSVWIGGEPIDSSLILYAGVAPGYAGLYQVNVRMPQQFPPNPELRLAVGDAVSIAGLVLAAQ